MGVMLPVLLLLAVGWLIMFVGGIRIIIAAFRVSPGWGLAAIFLPFAILVFLFSHWQEAKSGFLTQLLGLLVFFTGGAVMVAFGSRIDDVMLTYLSNLHPDFQPGEAGAGMDAGGMFEELGRMAVDAAEGIPPARRDRDVEPGALVGWTVAEVKDVFGAPQGELRHGAGLVLHYPNFQATSDDGVRISSVRLVEKRPAPAQPAPTGRRPAGSRSSRR